MTSGLYLKIIYLELVGPITDVADHFGTFHIVSKCKQIPVQKYTQIRQMKTFNMLRFNNILANA